MAVLRQANLLGQQRQDVPMLRQLDAAVAGDFDMIAGRTLAANRPLVVRGFTINTQGVVGQAANTLQLNTADGVVVNLEATDAGSMLWVPATRAAEILNPTANPNVVGSFTPGAVNNIGIDLVRSSDPSTADVAQFLDPNTKLETAKIVPMARTLNYQIVITTQPFSAQPNLIPIATVTTTAQNNIDTIVDARDMLGRLAPGGDFPSPNTGWSFATPRLEGSSANFFGPDKNFQGLKDWMDAVATRIWEVGGGEAWFSGTADRNVNFVFVGTPFTGGEYLAWDGTNLTWKGLRFVFDNSTGTFNDVKDQTTSSAGLTNLADGECVYVDLQRNTNATGGSALQAVKGQLASLGTGSPPGSRTIFAWRVGSNVFYRGWRFPVGAGFAPATTTTLGIVKLFQTPGSALQPVALNLDLNNSIAWTASGGNATALTVTGNGTGNGVAANGGTNNVGVGTNNEFGAGVYVIGAGGTQGGNAIVAIGGTASASGNGRAAGRFTGGAQGSGTSAGAGVIAMGGAGAVGGNGVLATGTGTSAGVAATGGATNGVGVTGTGGTTGAGGQFANGTAATASVPQAAVQLTNGNLSFGATANPNPNVGFSNTLTPSNVPKAWFHGITNGAGGFSTSQGFNMTLSGILGNIITFTLATGIGTGFQTCAVSNATKTTTGEVIVCAAFANGTATQVELISQGTITAGALSAFAAWSSTAGIDVSIVVFGNQ